MNLSPRALAQLVIDWLIDTLHPVENAPKWGAGLAALIAGELARLDLAIPPAAVLGLGVALGGLIGKIVQRFATRPRRPSARLARRRARRADRPAIDGEPCHV